MTVEELHAELGEVIAKGGSSVDVFSQGRQVYEIRQYSYFSTPRVFSGVCKLCEEYSTGRRISAQSAMASLQDHLRMRHGVSLTGERVVHYLAIDPHTGRQAWKWGPSWEQPESR